MLNPQWKIQLTSSYESIADRVCQISKSHIHGTFSHRSTDRDIFRYCQQFNFHRVRSFIHLKFGQTLCGSGLHRDTSERKLTCITKTTSNVARSILIKLTRGGDTRNQPLCTVM